MITYILLLKRKKGMTRAEFRHHYETSHVMLAKKFLGHLFLDYRRHFPIDSIKPSGEEAWFADEGFDAITKVDFKDQAAFDEFKRLCSLPHIKEALVEDEKRFLDREAVRVQVCEEVRTWTAADLAKSA